MGTSYTKPPGAQIDFIPPEICQKHKWDIKTCPFCRIAELEKALRIVVREVDGYDSVIALYALAALEDAGWSKLDIQALREAQSDGE